MKAKNKDRKILNLAQERKMRKKAKRLPVRTGGGDAA